MANRASVSSVSMHPEAVDIPKNLGIISEAARCGEVDGSLVLSFSCLAVFLFYVHLIGRGRGLLLYSWHSGIWSFAFAFSWIAAAARGGFIVGTCGSAVVFGGAGRSVCANAGGDRAAVERRAGMR